MLRFSDCPKAYTRDQDKAAPPAETVARVKAVLAEKCAGVLAETRRVDTGRLGIPVFLSVCGPKAVEVMPTRKQMGKGASPEQAEASALMELVERFSYFTFWATPANFESLSWSAAEKRFPGRVMPVAQVLKSVDEDLPEAAAASILDLVRWRFARAYNAAAAREELVPLDWFKKLNEFNGSSAGNRLEESVLQGACELVERHVSAVVDRTRPTLPSLDPESFADPVLTDLCARFSRNGVELLLKDMSLGLPAPTVGALAYDPKTFPGLSEIVFTAGTASSPVKAAIRAVTEVAQLAGDFETGRVYEASGLPKFRSPGEFAWLRKGPCVALAGLPDVEHPNILNELTALTQGLSRQGFSLYTVDTRHPDLDVPANYNFVPGFDFRERTPHKSLGLFVGRILAEESPMEEGRAGLAALAQTYPDAHFLPFFRGRLALRADEPAEAAGFFAAAEPLQPAREEAALCAFYQAYALSRQGRWPETLPHIERALALDDQVKEFFNLRGVARFKARDFEDAARDFEAVLALDSGSAADLANLGLCHKFLGRTAEALDYLHAALELDPGLDWARPHYQELLG
jgi:ribosomal protein S12 methylthiotransferase accessory factor